MCTMNVKLVMVISLLLCCRVTGFVYENDRTGHSGKFSVQSIVGPGGGGKDFSYHVFLTHGRMTLHVLIVLLVLMNEMYKGKRDALWKCGWIIHVWYKLDLVLWV